MLLTAERTAVVQAHCIVITQPVSDQVRTIMEGHILTSQALLFHLHLIL